MKTNHKTIALPSVAAITQKSLSQYIGKWIQNLKYPTLPLKKPSCFQNWKLVLREACSQWQLWSHLLPLVLIFPQNTTGDCGIDNGIFCRIAWIKVWEVTHKFLHFPWLSFVCLQFHKKRPTGFGLQPNWKNRSIWGITSTTHITRHNISLVLAGILMGPTAGIGLAAGCKTLGKNSQTVLRLLGGDSSLWIM